MLRNFAFGLLAATLVAGPGFAAQPSGSAGSKLPRCRCRRIRGSDHGPANRQLADPPNKADQDGQTHALALP